ncbi:ABC transporter permease [Dawidia soli]|uniref:ABC transporter permease n=1 Tax=Dawidia soli TaxID=2782352 RepID=A0AAP2DB39_9BACT|nr:ABC transporter permease [Dawidia soli]MBT1688247.1 ABC transporter permease [Dawidia soli]
MLQNYIKIAIRSLLKFKGYTAINLLGLALGLTAGILILLYVLDEVSYDKFHANLDRLYRVETSFATTESVNKKSYDANGWPIGAKLRDYPEVESVVYAKDASGLLILHDNQQIRQKMYFASPEFFHIFSFPLVKGDPQRALEAPYTIVISETMERKYFPGGDALNKTLTLADSLTFAVTGIMKDLPGNSHLQADMILSFATYPLLNSQFSYEEGWGNINVRNYLLLKPGVDIEAFQQKTAGMYQEHAGEEFKHWGITASVLFQPLRTLYLTSHSNGMGPLGSLDRLYLVSGIAVFVILLACINFINLTTARSVYRAKEAGLRKVVGSTRYTLIFQFLSESLLLTCCALLVALMLTTAILPAFNLLLDKQYTLTALTSPAVLFSIALLVVVVAVLSGYYPALVLSGLRPADVLKGKMQYSVRGVQLRRSLVVFQFVISVALVLGTLIVMNQLRYMQEQSLGFTTEEVLVIDASVVRTANRDVFQTFGDKLRAQAAVSQVSFANALPGRRGWAGQVAWAAEGRSEDAVTVEYIAVDEHYADALELQVIAGHYFDLKRTAALKDGLVLNERAVAMFGWASPADALGKRIASPSGYPAGEVVGVVRDYHQAGLQQAIGPIVMDYNPQASDLYAVRFQSKDASPLTASIHTLWNEHFPGHAFHYSFLHESFERQYESEQRLAQVFGLFSGVTVLIAVTGLLGLVSFMVVSRTKEIGVRKVLGAGVWNITRLLSREFLGLVLLANVIAIPVVWFLGLRWLESFATRVPLHPGIFVLTLVIVAGITVVTISFQTIRAALSNPVDALRHE